MAVTDKDNRITLTDEDRETLLSCLNYCIGHIDSISDNKYGQDVGVWLAKRIAAVKIRRVRKKLFPDEKPV